MDSEKLKTVVCELNPEANGGESVLLSVDIFDNGDGAPKGIYTILEVSLQSYSNGMTLTLADVTLEALRDACNEAIAEVAAVKASFSR